MEHGDEAGLGAQVPRIAAIVLSVSATALNRIA
jgi:hypothetical protein